MKKTRWTLAGAAVLVIWGASKAQEATQQAPAPPHQSEGTAFRWLERLRVTNPEEFQRLRRIREDNPEAFRAEIRRRMYKHLSEESDETNGSAADDSNRTHRPSTGKFEREHDAERLEADLLKLTLRYRAANDPEEKERIRREIRAQIEAVFNQRDAIWTQRIEMARKDLEVLEGRLNQWRAMREELIEKRIKAMLDELDSSPHSPPKGLNRL